MWQKHKFEENIIYTGKIGFLEIFLRKRAKVWDFSCRTTEDSISSDFKSIEELPDDIDWTHHVAASLSNLHLLPAMPDRPVVAKPEKSCSILPGYSLDIYCEIPLWVNLYASAVKPENLVLDVPVKEISSTWFGAPDNGELAYSLPEKLLLSTKEWNASDNFALCPLKIKNESETTLEFQRLSVPANQLNIYQKEDNLYTNELRVRFYGEDQQNEVQIVSGSPPIAQGSRLLSDARIKTSKSFLKKSFFFIKSFTQY